MFGQDFSPKSQDQILDGKNAHTKARSPLKMIADQPRPAGPVCVTTIDGYSPGRRSNLVPFKFAGFWTKKWIEHQDFSPKSQGPILDGKEKRTAGSKRKSHVVP